MTTAALPRRALLVSSDDEPTLEIEAALAAGGFEIVRCVEPSAPAFPCVGVQGKSCPLDRPGGVDLVVDARAHPWPYPTTREVGVLCALRTGVPVAVVTRAARHPFAEVASTVLPDADLGSELEAAIADALEPTLLEMRDAARAVFALHGIDTEVDLSMTRTRGRVHVKITCEGPSNVQAMAATRAASALRRHDLRSTAVEIDVVPAQR